MKLAIKIEESAPGVAGEARDKRRHRPGWQKTRRCVSQRLQMIRCRVQRKDMTSRLSRRYRR